MRKFRIINGDGKIIPLSENKKVFIFEIDGLGFDKSNIYNRMDSIYINTGSFFNQVGIKGKIFFNNAIANAYDLYDEFRNDILVEPIIFQYSPLGNKKWFNLKVDIKTLNKSEIEHKYNALICNFEFQRKSLWYRNIIKTTFENEKKEIIHNKTYEYSYDYKYVDGTYNTLVLDSDSNIESGAIIEIYGPCVNPAWKHYVNDKLETEGKINVTLEENTKIVIDTTGEIYSIIKTDMKGNLIADCYQLSNYNTYRFVLIKKGKNRVTVSADGTNELFLKVTGEIRYATV